MAARYDDLGLRASARRALQQGSHATVMTDATPETSPAPRGRPGLFLEQHADRRRLPVVLLSGFLGSGKTTLVNALLADPRLADTAVAVNEFGEVPLDQHLIAHGADRAVVLANGCLCCNLAGGFEDAVMRVFTRREAGDLPRFARLLIEPSGLADPAPIAQAILRNPVLSRAFRLEAILATADAQRIEQQMLAHPEAGRQIALADLLVVTKADLVSAAAVARVRAVLRRCNPSAPIETGRYGSADAAALLPARFLDPTAAAAPFRERGRWFAATVETGSDPDHLGETHAAALAADRPLRWRAFEAWLRGIRIGHAPQLLRVKGLLDIAGTAGPVLIQGVGHVLQAPVALARWPDQDRRSRLVVITRGLPGNTIRDSWEAALPGLIATTDP